MIRLFFDIETIPSSEEHRNTHVEILRKKKGNEEKEDDEIHGGTALDGTFGRICCIGYIKENDKGILQKDVLHGDEKEILKKFWETTSDVQLFIGHNVFGFDFPFIYKRSIINMIKPRTDLSFARYRNYPIYDTMMEWELWAPQKMQKLDTLAKILGLPTSKDEMDGSMVWDYFKKGKIGDICRYCMKDVELTRKVYYRMKCDLLPEEKPVPQPVLTTDAEF